MGIFHRNSGRPATLVIPVLRGMGVSLVEGEIIFTRFNSIITNRVCVGEELYQTVRNDARN